MFTLRPIPFVLFSLGYPSSTRPIRPEGRTMAPVITVLMNYPTGVKLRYRGLWLPPAEGSMVAQRSVPPRVNVGPSNPYVTAWGRSATLTCGVRDAKPNITSLHWKKDGERIVSRPLDAKYSGGNMQKPNLQIRHMTRADAGTYTCVADHMVRSTSASLVVDVLYPASIISISESVTATVSDSVTLQCVADGNPPPNITWTKDGSRLRSVHSALTGDVRMGSYLIKSVQANDTGTFLCTAENDIGESSTKSLSLTIKQLRRRVATSTIAVVVGATAGGLWLVVCVGLAVYVARRRKRKEEKKKFAFYYNMGRRDPGNGDDRLEEDKEPPPYSSVPAKPTSKTPSYGGINTMRKSLGKKERRYARAMYAYRPREDNELRLETDDVIEVLEGEDGGWCLGYLRGRIGLFPSNYVKFISSSEVLAMKAGGPCQTLALQESDTERQCVTLHDSFLRKKTNVVPQGSFVEPLKHDTIDRSAMWEGSGRPSPVIPF
ncbi:hypothetical protein Bbelb_324200 [Branchiostoma belcheri]|nr:hypothetical protein Bbelb_324200 [Branchiostoma belcheri]